MMSGEKKKLPNWKCVRPVRGSSTVLSKTPVIGEGGIIV
jgi:hypothetical protein